MKFRWILALLCCLTAVQAQEARLEGSELSLTLESIFLQNGFQATRLPLAITSQDVFSFNIVLELLTAAPATVEGARSTLIFDFTQEDAYAYREELLAFLRYLSAQTYDFDILVLCSALDYAPDGLSAHTSGTIEYAHAIEDADHTTVLTIHCNATRAIYTGSRRRITPRWLTEALCNAFYEKKLSYRFPHFIASFYRLGLIPVSPSTEALVAQGIATAGLDITGGEDFSLLQALCDNYDLRATTVWDSHYLFVRLPYPLRPIFVGEHLFVISTLILGSLVVLVLCAFSFIGVDSERNKRELLRSWFMIPITLVLSFLSLLVGQRICEGLPFLLAAPPLLQIFSKVVLSSLILSVLFFIQELLRIPVGQFVYGYIILLVAISNIFLFSAIDLQFFLPLLAEYIIIYCSRHSIELTPLVATVLFMLLPFAPYAYSIMQNGELSDIRQLILCTPEKNLLFTLLFFPFQVMWLRVLLLFRLYKSASKEIILRMLRHNVPTLCLLILVITALPAALAIISKRVAVTPLPPATIKAEDKDSLRISVSQTHFSDLLTKHISIRSTEAAVRYEVTLTSKEGVPLYDSTYNFVINESTRTARFELPDFPPQLITIDYAYAAKSDADVTVTALYRTEEPRTYRKEVRTLTGLQQ